eukprot:GHVL01042922.1.p1 GENE.GHVL01042922.1~~GHVL01042922.1.p1  ORF type:complete len:158 (+),score=54.59 GHVL01042922.1:1-474(+)
MRLPLGVGNDMRLPLGVGNDMRTPLGVGNEMRLPLWVGNEMRLPLGVGNDMRTPLGDEYCQLFQKLIYILCNESDFSSEADLSKLSKLIHCIRFFFDFSNFSFFQIKFLNKNSSNLQQMGANGSLQHKDVQAVLERLSISSTNEIPVACYYLDILIN